MKNRNPYPISYHLLLVVLMALCLRFDALYGQITFANKVTIATENSPLGIALGDFDGDGKPDMVVSINNGGYGTAVSVYRNTSSPGTISFAAAADFTVGQGADGVAIADFDGDGKLDIATANATDDNISVLLNTSTVGSISFAAELSLTGSHNPHRIVVADIDGDGKPDIVVTNNGSAGISFSVFRNTSTSGSLSFAAKVDFTITQYPDPIAIGDIDGDGKPDVIVTVASSNDIVSVFRNTSSAGSISFAARVDSSTGAMPLGVVAFDVDGDGKTDIVEGNRGPKTISVFRNLSSVGTISLASPIDFPTGDQPGYLTSWDLDKDGKADIIVPSGTEKVVSIYRNTSTSGFISLDTRVDLASDSGSVQAAVADIDGDGEPDIAVVNDLSNTVSMFRNLVGVPKAPQGLTASPGNGQVTLKWGKNTEADFLKYLLYMGTDSNSVSLKDSTTASISDTNKTIAGLTNGTRYYFRVSAIDSLRLESSKSYAVNATPSVLNTAWEYNPDTNTVLLLHMDETGGATVNDASNFHNNGSLGNGSFGSPGRFGTTIAFDGSTTNVMVGNQSSLNFSTAATLEAWIKPTSVAGSRNIVAKYNATGYQFRVYNGSPEVWFSSSLGITSSSQIPLNKWTHVAFRYSQGIAQLYINGLLDTQSTISPNLSSVSDLYIGRHSVAAQDYFAGLIDEVRISSSARAPNEFSLQLPPVNLTASASGTTITLSWQNGGGEVPLMRYKIYRGTDSTNVSLVDSTTSTSNSNAVAGNGTYFYRISAVDSTGFEGAKSWATKVSVIPPAAPQNLTANPGNGQVTLKWNKNTEADFLKYLVYMGTDSNSVSLKDSSTASITDTSKTLTGLANNTKFYFRVTALDSARLESSQSYAVYATPNAPLAAPQNLVVTDSSNQSITIKWRKNTETDFLRYRVYRGIASGAEVKIDSTTAGTPADTSRTYSGLTNGTRYFFRVSAVDSAGLESAYSNEVNAAPNPGFRVLSTTPTANALNVQTNAVLTVIFGADANPSTLTNSTIRINGSISGLHLATIGYNSGTTTATITPNSAFKVGEVVRTTLTRGIKSAAGDSLLNASTWSFSIKSDAGGSGEFVQSSTLSVGSDPRSITAGDWDGDGILDLAVADKMSSDLLLFLNDGNGNFKQSSSINLGGTVSVVAGDWNLDGIVDLAAVNCYTNSVLILTNNGNGVFTQTSSTTVGTWPWSITSGDWNRDGKLDLAVANTNSNNISILINNGDGSFVQFLSVNVGTSPMSIISGDFNNDGILDLAVVNNGSNTVSILLNNGSGVFTQSSTPSVGNSPQSVTAGDFNGDGFLDLVVANSGSSTVSILLNNGNGIFTQSSTPSVGSNPYSVATGDFDGDGFLDLAVVNEMSSTVSILLNNGSGTFTQSSTPSVGSYPISITSGDFNGDGFLDLAVTNTGSSTTSILLNRPRSASISLSSDSISFGAVGSGLSKNIYLKITNNGTETSLAISNIISSNAVFTLNRTSLTIAPGATDSVQVTFSPTSPGSFNDSLKIYSNDPRTPVSTAHLSGYSGYYISGVITSNTTWTKANSPYIINGNTSVDVGVTLSIQSGTQVVFNGRYNFNVDGTLQAIGVVGDTVIINSVSTDTLYPGINLRSGGTGVFAYVKLQNSAAAITTQSGSNVSVQNSRFTKNTVGFNEVSSNVTATLRSSRFDKNGTGVSASNYATLSMDSLTMLNNGTGLVCGSYANVTTTNSYFSGNGSAFSDQGNWYGNLTITNCDILSSTGNGIDCPYVSNLAVTNSRIIGNASYGIYAGQNSYNANGTISNNTIKSNSVGIYSNTTSLTITGNTITSNTGVGIQASTTNGISYNKITNNGSHGLLISGTPSITYNDILNNSGDGVQASNKPTLSYNRIYGNTGYGLNATLQASDSIIAKNNYWNATTDAAVSSAIHDYYDDGVTVRVVYKPYFTKPIFPPQNLAAISSVGQMKLSWSKGNPPSNFLRYRIYGGLTSAPTTKMDSTSNPADTLKILTGLTPGTTYYFRMTAVDSTGLESDYSNEVNTVQLPLVQLYTITPTQNQANVIANTQITATFGFDVNPVTVTSNTLKVNASLSGRHAWTSSYNSSTHTVTVTPSVVFKPGDVVTVTLTSGIKGVAGDSLAKPFSWCFTVKTSVSSGKFTLNAPILTTGYPTAIVTGDWNNDGLLDLAANVNGSIVAYTNNGDGTFAAAPSVYAGGCNIANSVATGDWNGDGSVDIAVTSCGSGVYILMNNGSGTFSQTSTVAVGNSQGAICSGDWNGDGKLDLAVANYSSNNVSILTNSGNGTFTVTSTVNVGTYPQAITAGDWNGDGATDLAVLNNGCNGTVSILINNGSGGFTLASTVGTGFCSNSAITSGDFNGDGVLDLAVGNNSNNIISILTNNGSGTFTLQSSIYSSNYYNTSSIISGDWNGDGILDFVGASNNNPGTVYIVTSNGSGGASKIVVDTLGVSTWGVAAGDFNNDGFLDLAAVNYNSNTISILMNHQSKARMLLSSPSIAFGTIATTTSKSSYLKFTNDGGDSSLVLSNLSVTNSVFTLNKISLTIPPLGNDSVQVTFTPTTVKNYTDSLSFTTNDPNSPSVKVALSGTGAAIPTAPALITPANNAINQPIAQTFKWNQSVSASTYRLQVATDSTFAKGIVLNDSTVTDTTRAVSGLSNNTKHYWRVNAKNFVGTSTYSSVWNFTTIIAAPSVPVLVSPANGATGQPLALTLVWNSAARASKYRVQVSTDSTFASGIVVNDSTVTDTTKAITGLNNSLTYYWRVNAQNIGGTSNYASFWRFTTIIAIPQTPILASPVNGSTSLPIALTLRWNKSSGTSTYRVQLGTDSTFASGIVVNDSTVTDTARAITGLSYLTTYYWRVNAKNSAGASAFSPFWSFKTQRTPPAAPQNLAATPGDAKITLTWNRNKEANFLRYRIYEGTSSGTEVKTDSTTGGIIDTTHLVGGLTNNAVYYFYVTAVDSFGTESAHSNEVTVEPNAAPAAPQNLTVTLGVSQVTLKWSKNTESDFLRYRVYRGLSSGTEVKVDSTTGGIADTSKTYTTLTNGVTYYFRVTAVDSLGLESGYSNEISVKPVGPPAAPKWLIATVGNQQVTLRWRANTEEDFLRYRVYKGTSVGSEVLYDSTSNGITDTMKTATGLTNGTAYYFKVTAVDSAGLESAYSNEASAKPTPQFVVSTVVPKQNALNVGTTRKIIASFSEDVNPATLTNSTIKVNGSLSGPHMNTFSYDSSKQAVTITANSAFTVGEVVTATLTRGIQSATGDSLSKSYTWSFSIRGKGNASGQFAQSTTLNVGTTPYSVTAGDFNGDGYLDLAVVNNMSNTVSILLNNGNNAFAQSSTTSAGSNPYSVTAGDFNGDGYLDLAVANSLSNTVSILLNNWNGTFTQSSTPSVGSHPYSVTAGDFNGDGYLDLAVANSGSNTVSILLDNGNGAFAQSSTTSVGSNPYSVTAGDFNGDGYLDLAVVNNMSNTVSILLNSGNGTFTQSSTPTVGSSPRSVTTGDFNGDGFLDLAVANSASNTVSILLNSGNGTFTQSSIPSVGSYPVSVTAGDFNGDGYLDLAVANSMANTVSILLNSGNGTFTQSSTPTVGSSPWSVITADFSGDGYLDVAVANDGSNTVSILLDRARTPSMALSTNAMTFGAVGSGSSKSAYVKITNDGTDSSLVISNISSSDGVFTLNRTSLTIAPGATDSVQVTFSPISTGSFNDSLQIYSNDPSRPVTTVYLSGYSGNYISGVISSNTTWTKANSPYIINGNTSVDVGVTLSIESGTQVVFNGRYSFNVDGTVQANGATGDTVVFTSVSTDTVYPGINLRSGGSGQFAYTKIQNASSAIATQSGSMVSIQSSRFTKNTVGFKDSSSNMNAMLRNSQFDGNSMGILATYSAKLTIDSCTFVQNTYAATCNYSATMDATNSIFKNNGVALWDGNYWSGNISIDNCDVLSSTFSGISGNNLNTLSVTNSRIIGNDSVGIYAGSTISSAAGLALSPISGNIIQGNRKGVVCNSNYMTITGNTIAGNTGIGIQTSSNSTISYNKITSNGSHGLVVTGTPSITYNDILDNTGDGIQTSSKPTVSYNRIYGNTGYGLNATFQASDSIIARNNYWNATTDAAVSTAIHDYYDDGVTVRVVYKPYFTKPLFPPQNLAAASSVGQMRLTWSKGNPPANFLRYRVYGGLNSGPTTVMDSTSSPADTTWILTGLTPGTKYYFRMTAMDSTGLESDYSNDVNAVQLPLVSLYSVVPTQNQGNVVANTQIAARFGFDVNTATVASSTLKVNASLSGPHAWTSSYNSSTHTVTVTPTIIFKPGDVVTVILTRGIKGTAGDSLTNPFTWCFTVKTTQGGGKFTINPPISTSNNPGAIATADFNNDGMLDLAVNGGNGLTIFINNRNGGFAQGAIYSQCGGYENSIVVGDWNGDGKIDIATTGCNSTYIFLGNGDGTFTQSSSVAVGNSPYAVISGDWNGDGKIDLAVANYSSNNISILTNNGTGTFTVTSTVSVGVYPQAMTAGDWNGDGETDLAVLNNGCNGTVSVLMNNGSGGFTLSSTVNTGFCSYSALTSGDFNGDGIQDLAVGNNNNSFISILRNDGTGAFVLQSAINSTNYFYSSSLVTGDWNGDGILDFASGSQNNPGTVNIVTSNGSGGSARIVIDTVGVSTYGVVAGDYNGDGTLDLAAVNYSSNTISILMNHPGAARIEVSPSALAFGVLATNTSADRYLKISNDGADSALVLTNLTVTNPVFTLNKTSLTISPLGSDSVLVTFTPAAVAIYTDSLSMMTNDPSSPILKVGLSGTGAAIPQAPIQIGPTNHATNQPIAMTFVWHAAISASTYRLQIGTDSTFASNLVLNDSTITDTLRSLSGLAYTTKYYWRVNAKNYLGTSAYSSRWDFTTSIAPPPVPVLAVPTNNATSQPLSLTLQWNPSIRTAAYRLQVSIDSSFAGNIILDDSTITDTTRTITGLLNSVTYYWRVRASNVGGVSSYSVPWKFTTVITIPPVPVLLSPVNDSINTPTAMTLKWHRVFGAATYRAQLGVDSNFVTGLVLNDSTITDTTRFVSGLNYLTKYYWRVNAKNVAGSSAFSGVWNFITVIQAPSTPILALPADGSMNQPTAVTFKWNSTPRASAYRVQVSADTTFSVFAVVYDTTLSDTSKTIAGLTNGATYYWRVSARNTGGTSLYTSAWMVSIIPLPPSTPILAFPQNDATNRSVTLVLRWYRSAFAQQYHVQVGMDSSFASGLLVNDSTITDTGRVVVGLSYSTQYLWRVSASNVAGASGYSGLWSFATGPMPTAPPAAPILASPINGAINQPTTVMAQWNACLSATSYRLQVATDSNFVSHMVVNDSTIVDTARVIDSLADNSKYYWRVNARNVMGTGNWSGGWSFTTKQVAPLTPTLAGPADSSSGISTSPTFSWNAVAGATSYRLQVSKDPLFATTSYDGTSNTSTSNAVTGLDFLTRYYWRVNASNGVGVSGWSIPWSFTTVIAAPVLVSPTNNAQAVSTSTTLAWNAVSGATSYRLQVSTDSLFGTTFYDQSGITVTSKSISGLAAWTKYFWRASATNAVITSAWCTGWNFTTVVGPPTLVTPANSATGVSTNPTFTWNVANGATTCRIQISRDTSFATTLFDMVGVAGTSKTVTGLPYSTVCYWRMSSSNSSGTGPYSLVWSFTTVALPLPPAPWGLAVSAQYPRNIRVTWSDSSSIEDGFKLERKVGGSGTYNEIAIVGKGASACEDSVLAEWTIYAYRVRAYNVAGNSSYTNVDSARTFDVTPPTSPINISVTPTAWTKSNQFTVTWSNPADASGIAKVLYRFDSQPTAQTPGDSLSLGGGALFHASVPSVGNHVAYVYLEDVAGNRNPASSVTVQMKFDNVPPTISHDSSAVAAFSAGNPQPIAIVATASDGNSQMMSAQLQYKRSGTDWSQGSSVSYASPTGGTAYIPSSYLTLYKDFGVDYRVSAEDSAGNVSYAPTHSVLITIVTTLEHQDASGNSVTQMSVSSLPSGTEPFLAYRLFSVPLNLDNKTPQDVLENRTGLGAYDIKVWRFYKLNDDDSYSEYPDFSDQPDIDVGKAFFLVLKNGTVLKTGTGAVVKAEDMAKTGIPLKAGYNLVGNPFSFDVPTDSLSVTNYGALPNGTFTNNWWEFAGATGTNAGWTPNPSVLKAWEGIVIKTTASTTLKINISDRPKSSAAPDSIAMRMQKSASTSSIAKPWTLRIKGMRLDNKLVDEENIVGVRSDAIAGLNRFDMIEPPMFSEAKTLSISFPHGDELLTHDIQPPNDEGYFWDFTVRTPDRAAKIQLTFEGVDSVPKTTYLIDVDEKMAWTVSKETKLAINSGNGTRTFRIIVGDKQFAEKNSLGVDLVPKAFKLFANYPNPFNPETVIRYTLPDNTSAYSVTLKIYNILGQEIKTLVDYAQEPGYYEVPFNARGLSSGVYIYRLAVGLNGSRKFVDQKKMLLIK